MKIEKAIEYIIRGLDRAINVINLLVNSLIKIIDYIIKTLENVSRMILGLFKSLFRLSFYILPFILFIIIGNERDWGTLFWIGIVVLVLVAVLFVRNFIAQFKGNDKSTEGETSKTARRVVFIMWLLNIITILYSICYFFFGIKLEEAIKSLFLGKG